MTHSFIFPEDVVTQGTDVPGMPATWGTHRIDFAGYQAGTPVIADYEMDPDVVNDPRYGAMLRDGLTSLPTLSLVTDPANLDIYFEDPQARGREFGAPRLGRVDLSRRRRTRVSSQQRRAHPGRGGALGIHAQALVPSLFPPGVRP